MERHSLCAYCRTGTVADGGPGPVPICGLCIRRMGILLRSADPEEIEDLFALERPSDPGVESLSRRIRELDSVAVNLEETPGPPNLHYDLAIAYREVNVAGRAIHEFGYVLEGAWDADRVSPAQLREALDWLLSFPVDGPELYKRFSHIDPRFRPSSGETNALSDASSAESSPDAQVLPFPSDIFTRPGGRLATGTDDRKGVPRRDAVEVRRRLDQIRDLKEGIASTPEDMELRSALARAYLEGGNAVLAAEQLLVIARSHAAAGRPMKAVPLFKQVIELEPGRLKARVELAESIAALGLTDQTSEVLGRLTGIVAGWLEESQVHLESPWLGSTLPVLMPQIDSRISLLRRAASIPLADAGPIAEAQALTQRLEGFAARLKGSVKPKAE